MTKKQDKAEKLYEGITEIRSNIIEQAEHYTFRKPNHKKKKYLYGAIAAALAFLLLYNAFFTSYHKNLTSVYAISEAQYPKMASFPEESSFLLSHGTLDEEAFSKAYHEWREDVDAQNREISNRTELETFFTKSTETFLKNDSETDSNPVYSPVNLYMALSMLAELTGGNSQKQILQLLSTDHVETLRKQASDVWNSSYQNDGATSSILANSIWMNQDIKFQKDTLEILKNNYYTSSYQGKMGSAKFNKALSEWLNTQTGGLLKEQAEQIELNPETILSLASTVYFRSKWSNQFSEEDTKEAIFHTLSKDVMTDFMNDSGIDTYYWSDNFSAISKGLESNGSMWFILPDEGISTDTLLEDSQFISMILNPNEYENQQSAIINCSIPKFDITSQIELSAGLKQLGVTDIFDPAISDFTSLTKDSNSIALTKAQHDTRVAIDEEGVTAAAYTSLIFDGAGCPDKKINFVADRPFIFAITTKNNLPLFVGIVNHPD